ncbi:MAG: hypothetical protein ACRCZ1_05725 [Cetobacterium sp.]
MNNKQKAILKKALKIDGDFLELYNLYNVREITTFSKNLDNFLNYVQEEIKDYLKNPSSYDDLIYTIDKKYIDISYIDVNGLLINFDVLYKEYKEYINTL